MSNENLDMEVDFAEYCKTCKYCKRGENIFPCCDCLENPVNVQTEKPLYYNYDVPRYPSKEQEAKEKALINSLRAEIARLDKEIVELNATHTAEVEKLERTINSKQKLINSLKVRIADLEKQIEETDATHTAEVEKLNSRIVEYENQVSEMTKEIDSLHQDIDTLTLEHAAEVERLNKQLVELQQRFDEISNWNLILQDEKAELEAQISSLQEDNDILRSENSILSEQNQGLQSEIDSNNNDFEAIRQAMIAKNVEGLEDASTSEYAEIIDDRFINLRHVNPGLSRNYILYRFSNGQVDTLAQIAKITPEDTSPLLGAKYMFRYNMSVKEIPDIIVPNANSVNRTFADCTNLLICGDLYAPNATDARLTYNNSNKLHTIGTVNISSATDTTSMFANCPALETVTFDGEIPVSIGFATSPLLTVDSLISILTHLKNYADTDKSMKYTVTLTDECWDRLETSGMLPPTGGTWKEYVDSLGWKC